MSSPGHGGGEAGRDTRAVLTKTADSMPCLDPWEEEDQYDRKHVDDAADDSEEEDDVDICYETKMDALAHAGETRAATVLRYAKSSGAREDAEPPDVMGAPLGWRAPTFDPNDIPPPKIDCGEPESFDLVDNPGRWNCFCYQPVFDKDDTGKGNYMYHALPTGATPVPEVNGVRQVGGWDFHYQGWRRDPSRPAFRSGASRDNPLPESRRGCLDKDMLIKLGMSSDRMDDGQGRPDALFFHQLLLPICDIQRSGIDGDPRKPFYLEVCKFTNFYACSECGFGCGYIEEEGQLPEIPELVRWDGVTVMDGVKGGTGGAMLRRFNQSERTAYDSHIANAFTKERWLLLKRIYKLNINTPAKKKGMAEYNPAYKYDFIFDVIISNVNAITKDACLDLCGDEITYTHQEYDQSPRSTQRFQGFLKKPLGVQMVIISDVDRLRPRAYLHRHKRHKHELKLQGPSEVKHILDCLTPLIDRNELAPRRGIFRSKPHLTWDNFFPSEEIFEHAAEHGYGLTMLLRGDRIPTGIPKKYLHVKKTLPGEHRAHITRFMQPIIATKKIGNSLIQLTSFQSTSSCNFLSVDAYNECGLYAQPQEKGRFWPFSKQQGAVEMNDARELYLRTYHTIDQMDHAIKSCKMYYRSWKYWHAAMLLAKAMAVAIAYDVYCECAEGKLDDSWELEEPVDFYTFRECLAKQMLQYSPCDRKYPGDSKFRVAMEQDVEKNNEVTSPSPKPRRRLRKDDGPFALFCDRTRKRKERKPVHHAC